MDSRTSSILINLDLDLNTKSVSKQYLNAITGIEETEKQTDTKTYRSLRSALKESYLTGSLRYGKSFIS